MAVTLPEAFAHRMKEMLGEEFPAFLAAYEQPHLKGVRVNPLKCAPETLQKAMSGLRPSPFSPLCFTAKRKKWVLCPPSCRCVLFSGAVCILCGDGAGPAARGTGAGFVCGARGKIHQIAACLMGGRPFVEQ